MLFDAAEIISNVRDLQSLNVDVSAEKERQKAEVKHILQQKQRGLSDLFKMLAQIGESTPLVKPPPRITLSAEGSRRVFLHEHVSPQACRIARV